MRRGVNSSMAEVMEDHIRLHLAGQGSAGKGKAAMAPDIAEDLIDLVRAYLK